MISTMKKLSLCLTLAAFSFVAAVQADDGGGCCAKSKNGGGCPMSKQACPASGKTGSCCSASGKATPKAKTTADTAKKGATDLAKK